MDSSIADFCNGSITCYVWLYFLLNWPLMIGGGVISFVGLTIFYGNSSIRQRLLISLVFMITQVFIYNHVIAERLEKRRIVRSIRSQMVELDYALYQPTTLPNGYNFLETRMDFGAPDFYYTNGKSRLLVSLYQKPAGANLNPPNCKIYFPRNERRAFSDAYHDYSSTLINAGDCIQVTTPKGNSIYLTSIAITTKRMMAVAVFNETMITISGDPISQAALIAIVDGLQEVKPSNIDIKIQNWTIGR